MKIKIENIFSGILVICALIVTFLLLRKEFFDNNKSINIIQVDNWEKLIVKDEKIDNENPKIYLIEFFDYECPYCNNLESTLDSIKLMYNDKIKLIRYHLPLNIHPHAYKSAIASECAKLQNNFDKFHKELMKNQYKLNNIDFIEVAKKLAFKI